MPRQGYNAFRSYRRTSTRRARGRGRRPSTTRRMRISAPVFVPSWLQNSAKVVSNGINSLLREINTKRRKSLGERKSRNSGGINSLLREINTKRRRSLGETRKSR